MARGATELWLTITYFERWFDIRASTLKNKGVHSRYNQENKTTEYNVDDFFNKCSGVILKRLIKKHSSDSEEIGDDVDLDRLKKKAEIKKLEIDEQNRRVDVQNKQIDLMIRQGKLCDVEEFSITVDKAFKQIADKLDTVPSRVKQENPTVSQNVLATIQSVMIEVRNNIELK